MKYWTTTIKAIDPKDGQLKKYSGQTVLGISFQDAENYCQNNGLGYLTVEGELIAEIPCDENFNPIWNKSIDYDIIQNN